MKTVKEVSQLTGITIRTLHHYDKIGLLKPSVIKENGYRYYDDDNLRRLQEILLFRELEFPLKAIDQILNHRSYDRKQALRDHITLLELKEAKLKALLAFARDLEKGAVTMSFEAFKEKEYETYQAEVKERWGTTQAYAEFEAKKGKLDYQEVSQEMSAIFAQFGVLKDLAPDHEKVQAQVKTLQDYITNHFYTCTNEILAGLAQMYVADKRFKENIDQMGGPGTADFASDAIAIYCQK
ncbi:MerR family transcriptional regulator [Streptococcus penaeicida]|uniref:MerR family transcriptional regulator n=1 Tax=Streptococcus penaeicida TaxID=1765960 RepID=A0A2N8LBP1_9STRE|nr:MerR family transcriptional regulator [Streptococcus penaeicida]PND47583.1 MerR family transcriptional regulator [Streptococcus penaeicida]